ncbi:restriction endonuclease [bacterium]|nr:restriction endonuclease [bacterium]
MCEDKAEKELREIQEEYERVIRGVEKEAQTSKGRAYGGFIRAEKGKLVEKIGKDLIRIAWRSLSYDEDILKFENKIIKIPIREGYIEKVSSLEVREYIKKHIKKFYYPLKPDIQVVIKNELAIALECKAYTENAMLKRILVVFTLLKQVHPKLAFVLLQLESQLGGDYSSPGSLKYGSPSTHTLLSYFDIDLNIITLLEGERRIDRPIHKPEFYKPLTIEK